MTFGLPCVLAKCHHNALNALIRRHLSNPPNAFCAEFHPSFRSHIANHIAPMFHYRFTEDEGKWADKKTLVKRQQIAESQVRDRVELNRAKSFIKREVNPGIPTKARLIQGNQNDKTAYLHPDAYKAISNLCSNIVYSVDGVEFDLHYTSHLNREQISALFSVETARPGYRYYDERDGKNWDSTMQEPHMRFEASLYELFDTRIADNHIIRSTQTFGLIRSKQCVLKYVTAWKRLSGDWNTSIGNTLISMAIIISVILSLPSHLKPRRVFGMFLGDDYLGVYNYASRVDPNDLNAAMMDGEKKFGITPSRAIFLDPMLCEYISMTVWPAYDGTYVFVPKMSNLLVKLFYSVHPPTKHTAQDAIATIMAIRPCYDGLRFMQRFLTEHAKGWKGRLHQGLRAITKYNPNTFLDRHREEALSGNTNSINWAYGFAHKFRLPLTSLDFELPAVDRAMMLNHPTIDIIFQLEHLDPADRLALA